VIHLRHELESLDPKAEYIRGLGGIGPGHHEACIGEVGADWLEAYEGIRERDPERRERHVRQEGNRGRAEGDRDHARRHLDKREEREPVGHEGPKVGCLESV